MSTLPKDGISIRFPTRDILDREESYQLLELPSDILKAVENGATVPLTIKGRPSDDAVLCTDKKTYTLRTVAISNSLLVLRPPPAQKQTETEAAARARTLHIRDMCHQVLECLPSAGRTERLATVLRDSAWPGLGSSLPSSASKGKRKRTGKRYTRAQLESIIQASESELERGLKENNVIEVDGHMILLPPAELGELLELLLTLVTVHADVTTSEEDSNLPTAPFSVLVRDLEADHDVPRGLAEAVMGLFGTVTRESDTWVVNMEAVVREIGRGLLVRSKETKQPTNEFMHTWTTATGEPWSRLASLSLLTGDYVLEDPPLSAFAAPSMLISYYPASALPLHAPLRFGDLFEKRPRWRPDDMIPFMRGLYPDGDVKARDKLVAKFIRVVKEKEGVWWYPRRNGFV